MMIVVLIFAVRSLKHRYGKCYKKYGPLFIIVLAVFLIMAEPTRHVVSDYNIWAICWNNPKDALGQPNGMVRINQTWNDRCAWSSLEYHCNVPCCVTDADYNKSFPNGVMYPETKNDTMLDLTDPAWQNHFLRYKCYNASDPSQYQDTKFCDGGGDKCSKPNCPSELKTEAYECVCDACVFHETLNFLSPVGMVFTITLTYIGFVLLAIGSLWNADIVAKIKKLKTQCQKLKERQARKKARENEKPLLPPVADEDPPVADEAPPAYSETPPVYSGATRPPADEEEEECAT